MKFLYTTLDSVKIRLVNKVQFQSDSKELQEGELPDELLCQLINDAETEVEQDLRTRYTIPLQSKRTKRFIDLPDHSQRAIRKVVDLKAVMLVLETDFGRGTHITAEGYVDKNASNYTREIKRLLGMDMIGEKQHERFKLSPPLEDLLLAFTNKEADDGYRGRIINTDASEVSSESYATDQVNNPSQTFLNRRVQNPAGG